MNELDMLQRMYLHPNLIDPRMLPTSKWDPPPALPHPCPTAFGPLTLLLWHLIFFWGLRMRDSEPGTLKLLL